VVVVDDALRYDNEWVINGADLENAPLLRIQDLGPEVTRRVASIYGRGEVWRLTRDSETRVFRLQAEAP
jgi:hypothetical protein